MNILPPGLCELTLARTCPPAYICRRSLSTVANLASRSYAPPALYPHKQQRIFLKPKRPELPKTRTFDLQSKITALEKAASSVLEKLPVNDSSAFDPPSFSEEDLTFIYQDLLSQHSPEHGSKLKSQVAFDPTKERALLEAAASRLQSLGMESQARAHAPLSDILYGLRGQSSTPETNTIVPPTSSTPAYHRVLWHLRSFSGSLKQLNSFVSITIPVTILSLKEWQALISACILAEDGEATELTLSLMKLCRLPDDQFASNIDSVLSLYANTGKVSAFESCLSRFVTGMPTENQRHLHVKVYLRSNPSDVIPLSALSILHGYEAKNLPAPMKTYAKLISVLFSIKSAVAKGQAWDLFTHMRYIAHPNPDDVLYTMMIRACASPISASVRSEPERALDLWTEMTVDHQIAPTLGSYNAVILACARSGTKTYVNEAFRIVKEMLDAHRDAYGKPLFKPSRKTFCALLEGAKRLGDLERARWILAEMVRSSQETKDIVDEEVMMHVFHAYATYTPPFTRSLVRMVDNVPPAPQEGVVDSSAQSTDVAAEEQTPMFGPLPPQSRDEVITEAEVLFHQIIEESGAEVPLRVPRFHCVELSSRLVNSYLSVHYRHSSLEKARQLFWSLFEEVDIKRNPRSFSEALQRCAFASRYERQEAFRFAGEIMVKWETLEEQPSARLIETVYSNYIRILTLVGKIEEAMNEVRRFVAKYPPSSVQSSASKLAIRGTRTSLVASRPLVRMTSTVDMPDDAVPPILTFRDLELLHHKLIAEGDEMQVSYIKYICKTYEGKLRTRRCASLRAKPEAEGRVDDVLMV